MPVSSRPARSGRAASVRAGWIGVRPITWRIMLSAAARTVPAGIARVEQEVLGVLDSPEDGKVDVDDVLVAGQHQRLGGEPRWPVSPELRSIRSDGAAHADLDAVDAGDRGGQRLTRSAREDGSAGQDRCSSGRRRTGAPRPAHPAGPDRRRSPARWRAATRATQAEQAARCRRKPGLTAARHEAAGLLLQPLDDVVEIGNARDRPGRARPPPLGPRGPPHGPRSGPRFRPFAAGPRIAARVAPRATGVATIVPRHDG